MKTGELPDCMTAIGCRMGEDVARDQEAELVVLNYARTKMIPSIRDVPIVAARVLDDVGLLEDYELLTLLEYVFYSFEKEKAEAEGLKDVVERRTRDKATQF